MGLVGAELSSCEGTALCSIPAPPPSQNFPFSRREEPGCREGRAGASHLPAHLPPPPPPRLLFLHGIKDFSYTDAFLPSYFFRFHHSQEATLPCLPLPQLLLFPSPTAHISPALPSPCPLQDPFTFPGRNQGVSLLHGSPKSCQMCSFTPTWFGGIPKEQLRRGISEGARMQSSHQSSLIPAFSCHLQGFDSRSGPWGHGLVREQLDWVIFSSPNFTIPGVFSASPASPWWQLLPPSQTWLWMLIPSLPPLSGHRNSSRR